MVYYKKAPLTSNKFVAEGVSNRNRIAAIYPRKNATPYAGGTKLMGMILNILYSASTTTVFPKYRNLLRYIQVDVFLNYIFFLLLKNI